MTVTLDGGVVDEEALTVATPRQTAVRSISVKALRTLEE